MKLRTSRFKADPLDLDLGGRTILVGPNGSGKSSAADALRFLALGYIPGLGKRPIDTAAFMGGDEMAVALLIDKGRVIQRVLKRDGDALVQEVEVSWLKKAKTIEASKEILGLFGTEEADVAECLDIRTLLNAKPNERAARIEALMASAGLSAEKRAAIVYHYTVQRLIGVIDENMPEKTSDAIAMVKDSQRAILKTILKPLQAKLSESGFGEAIDWANSSKREASKGVKRGQQAKKKLEEKLQGIPEPAAAGIKALDIKVGDRQKRVGALGQAHQTYRERIEAKASAEERITDLEKGVEHATDQHAEALTGFNDNGPNLKDDSVRFQKEVDGLFPPSRRKNDGVELLKKLVADLSKSMTETMGKVPLVTSKRNELRAMDTARAELNALKGSDWSDVLEISERLIKAKITTKAKTFSTDLEMLNEIAKKNAGSTVADAEEKLKEATAAFDKVDAIQKKEMDVVQALQTKHEGLEKKKVEAAARLSTEETEDREAHDARVQEVEQKRQHALSCKSTADRELQDFVDALASAESAKISADKSLAAAKEIFGAMPAAGDKPADPDKLQKEVDELAERLRHDVETASLFKQLTGIIDEIDEEKAEADVWSSIENSLQRARGEELNDSGGKLLKFMASFLKAAGRSETPFVRASTGFCSVGWTRKDGREVQAQVLSGGEWCIFAAAITSAVVLIRPSKLKVLLIEAGEADETTIGALMKGIDSVEEGLSLALVMTHQGLMNYPKGWKVIHTQEGAVAPPRAKARSKKKGVKKDAIKKTG